MTDTAADKILFYFADPMCSWCWGFAPVIESIKQKFADDLKIALILGGLRPGSTEPMDEKSREDILHHWHEVHKRTGQSFLFDGAMPEGFIYDTEPPSRAVVAMGELNSDMVLPYFKSIQAAFYSQGRDVTQPDTLSELAVLFEVDASKFEQKLEEEVVKQKTLAHFHRARQFGVRGFPTLVLQNNEGYTLLTHGYQPFEFLDPQITAWLG
ncbi:DsbA family protein [Kaarinaea lacus]